MSSPSESKVELDEETRKFNKVYKILDGLLDRALYKHRDDLRGFVRLDLTRHIQELCSKIGISTEEFYRRLTDKL